MLRTATCTPPRKPAATGVWCPSSPDGYGCTDDLTRGAPVTDSRTTDASLGELVANATRDLSSLVHQEVELAKVEIKRDVAAAGKGAGMFGGAGFAGVFALLFLSVSAAYGIEWLGVPLGCSFFAVGVIYLVIAGAL